MSNVTVKNTSTEPVAVEGYGALLPGETMLICAGAKERVLAIAGVELVEPPADEGKKKGSGK